MGFLDSLKEIGIGNTGPYGRMTSGATNFSNYIRDRQGIETERGVAKALAMAAKNGKELTMQDYIDISDKWGVPLNELITRGKNINNSIFAQTAKKKLQTAMKMFMDDKKSDPGLNVDQKYIMDIFDKVGIEDPRIMGMFKDALLKMQDQKTYMQLDKEKEFGYATPLGGYNKIKAAEPKPSKPTDNWIPISDEVIGNKVVKRQRNKTTGEIKRTVVDKGSAGSGSSTSNLEKERQDFLKSLPDGSEYKNNLTTLDYVKLKKQAERDPIVAATSLAEKNIKVQAGAKDLGEAVQEILDVWKNLGYIEDKEPAEKYEVPKLTDQMIKYYVDEYGMTREDVIKKYNEKYGK